MLSSFSKKLKLGVFLFARPLYGFAKLPTTDVNLDKSEIESGVGVFYEDVLRASKITAQGRVKVNSRHFASLVQKVKKKEEFPFVIDAFYNFVGHGNGFSQKAIDEMVRKGIENGHYKLLVPIIENHNLMYYYPHPEILTLFIQTIIKDKNFDLMKRFLKVFYEQRLLKPEVKTYEALIHTIHKKKFNKDSLKLIYLIHRDTFLLSNPAFEKLAFTLIHYYKNASNLKLSVKRYEKLKSLQNPDLEKSSKIILIFSWLNLFLDSHGSLAHSFLYLEDFVKNVASEIDSDPAKKDNFIFENTPLFVDFFKSIEKRLHKENDQHYFLKFDKFFSDFDEKYSRTRIAPDLLLEISNSRKLYIEKAEEIKNSLPQRLEEVQEKLAERIQKRNEKLKRKEPRRKSKIEEMEDEREYKIRREAEMKWIETGGEEGVKPFDPAENMPITVLNRRREKKVLEDPKTGMRRTVITSKRKDNNPDRGVYYKR